MSNYRLEDEFIHRTKKNLEFIRKHQKDHPDEVFEVTQFMNSLLGLLIFPKERYYKMIPLSTLDSLKSQGYDIPKILRWHSDETQDLQNLVRHLRNSVSHMSFEFISFSDEIEEVLFHDNQDFVCEFDLITFQNFILRLADEMEKVVHTK